MAVAAQQEPPVHVDKLEGKSNCGSSSGVTESIWVLMLQKNGSQSSRKGNNRLTPHMHPDEATGRLIITPAQHMRPQRPGKGAESRRWAQGVKDNPPHGVPSEGLTQDRDPRGAGSQVDGNTPDLQALVAPAPLTSARCFSALRQRSVAPKQKHLVQPLGLVASKENVPRRHWSHLRPSTFS